MKIINYNKNIILPNSLILEEAILGTIIMNKKCLEKIINVLKIKYFFYEKNKILFFYIKKIYYEYNKVDLLNLIYFLKNDNKLELIGNVNYLSYIIQKITSFYNIKKYVKLLKNKYIIRKLIFLSYKIIIKCNRNNVNINKLFDFIQNYIFKLYYKNKKNNIKNFKYLLYKTFKNIKNNYLENKLVFISTGFKKLDNIILGLQKSDFIIIASRPGMGKTSFALSLVKNILNNNKISIGLFSLEMSYNQIIIRLLSFNTKLTYKKLNNFNFDKNEFDIFKKKFNNIKKYNLFIDDSSTLSILELKEKCKKLVNKYNVKIIIIDYLQLINIKKELNLQNLNREQEISLISRTIKYISKKLKITIIALSQLSRAVELRGGYKRPLLSDLRESGAIEQDSDIVIFLYRPDYYGYKYWYDDNTRCLNQAEVIIAKHRNGRLGNFKLNFIKKIAFFKN
ncbi:MAG: replicative DNA helicase [Candidatus Shikimatogenerans sp. JK-2022]|nr:replicative DNA helicase [Candidatus Shikimatogenerans bostrichidophilus]